MLWSAKWEKKVKVLVSVFRDCEMALSWIQLQDIKFLVFSCLLYKFPFKAVFYCSPCEKGRVLCCSLSHSSVVQQQAWACTEERWFQGNFHPHCVIWGLHVHSGSVDTGLWFWAVSWSAPFAWCSVCWVSLGVTAEIYPLVKRCQMVAKMELTWLWGPRFLPQRCSHLSA